MIMERTIRNRTQLLITEEGKTTLGFFENRISPEIKKGLKIVFVEQMKDVLDVAFVKK